MPGRHSSPERLIFFPEIFDGTMEQVIESSNNAFSEVCRVRDLIISEQQALVLNQQAMILRLTAEKEKSDRWIRRLAWVAGVSAAFALGMLIVWCTT